jgi:hypothetical protein
VRKSRDARARGWSGESRRYGEDASIARRSPGKRRPPSSVEAGLAPDGRLSPAEWRPGGWLKLNALDDHLEAPSCRLPGLADFAAPDVLEQN